MGIFLSRALDSLGFGKQPARILMLGLDAAGKTTVLYKLKIGDCVTTVPTIGFNVEELEYKNLTMTVWDIGGQDKIRSLWRYYYQGTDAVIFVVDSLDHARLPIARDELHKLVTENELRDASVLVFANKQDLPGALTASAVSEGLELGKLSFGRSWWVQPTAARTGEGLYEGLEWLSKDLCARRRVRQ